MPLPDNPKLDWPPTLWRGVYDLYTEHDAWYSGDPNRLAGVYSGLTYQALNPTTDKFFSDVPAFKYGTDRAKFWAKRVYGERLSQLHVPLAGDIAAASADMLFSEPPKFFIPEADQEGGPADAAATQDLLNEFIEEDNVVSKLVSGAETGAALGGVFLKINWDINLVDRPILSFAQADAAFPEFKFGILTAVTFWRVVLDKDRKVWRHLERHEVVNGKAVILNGLYIGDAETLGTMVGLEAHPATADLSPVIQTTILGLDVEYIPNRTPHRRFRGSPLGMSDYAGAEGLMDSLDEVYTSWMRDIRLARGRVMVSEAFLKKDATGRMAFDVDQEIYTQLEMDPMTAKDVGITPIQFAIRTQEHQEAALGLMERIVTSAGYSPQTFGIKIEGRAESGTALRVRERKSFITTGKKQAHWKRPVERMLFIALQLYNDVFKRGVALYRPQMEFGDTVVQDMKEVADTVNLLATAKAASQDTMIRMVHPDWNDEQIQAELDKISAETQAALPQQDPNFGMP